MKKPNNRWAVVMPSRLVYLCGSYFSVADVIGTCPTVWKYSIVYIPKYAYHLIADGALE